MEQSQSIRADLLHRKVPSALIGVNLGRLLPATPGSLPNSPPRRASSPAQSVVSTPSSAATMPLVTVEDLKIAFNFFCCVYGIGTLGLPANFARSGPVIATIAMVVMGFINVCSCVAISRVMLAAPKSVKTYGDVGEWCCGPIGRSIVLFAQFGVCCLVPCAFLVLGGILLDGISPDSLGQAAWSVIMAIMLLPVFLTPTLKENAVAAAAGFLGTVFADGIALVLLVNGIGGDHPDVVHPDITLEQATASFGNLALAYSAAVLVPALQREHSQPERMPRVVAFTMIFCMCLFLIIGETSFAYVGCQIPGNLLFAVGGTALNLNASRAAVVLAYLLMQVHITIGFSVILNPVMYIAERGILGMHKRPQLKNEAAADEETGFQGVTTPELVVKEGNTAASATGNSVSHGFSVTSLADAEYDIEFEELRAEYRGTANTIKYMTLRTVVVVILLILAIIFKDHFMDFSDFVGACCVSLACMILPIFFYLKVFWGKVPIYEKVIGILIILLCSVLGVYVTYTSGKALFTNETSGVNFPYCPEEYSDVVYTNTSYYGTN